MQIVLNLANVQDWSGAVLVVGLLEDDLKEQLSNLEKLFEGLLLKNLDHQDFSAKSGEMACFQILKESSQKIVLVGMGTSNKLSLNELRKAVAIGARACIGTSGSLGMLFPWDKFDLELATRATCEAARLSLFQDLRFKSNKKESPKRPEKLELIGLEKASESCLKEINATCAGVELARELVGAPPNKLTPSSLAQTALEIANQYSLQCKILSQKECEKLNMGAYLAVAKGSDLKPNFIHLIYKSKEPIKHRLVLIGKGLTFDSGGYNLKVGASQIDMMKFDMGGSAAVLGAARTIGELCPIEVEVHFLIAACENMINGSAIHPGDIVNASNGTSIEINNTDAEGRLTLADALVYACKLEPDEIVDLATLTGACVIALGDQIAGLWTDNDELANNLLDAANEAGEGLWRMPMHNSYKEGLKSTFADIKNTGPRAGGSITAALFLKEFVQASIPWAHIDIAGTVWAEKDRGLDPAGATGYGVRTLINWVINRKNK